MFASLLVLFVAGGDGQGEGFARQNSLKETAAPTDTVRVAKPGFVLLSAASGRRRQFLPLFDDFSYVLEEREMLPYLNIDTDKFEVLVAVPGLDNGIFARKYSSV